MLPTRRTRAAISRSLTTFCVTSSLFGVACSDPSRSFSAYADHAGASSSRVIASSFQLARVSGGSAHSCGLTSGGAAYCWGFNAYGQLGTGTTTDSKVPVPVVGGLSFTFLAAGQHHNCGIATSGTTYCWGFNRDGQLGNGTLGGISTVPLPVVGSQAFAFLAAALYQTCGVTVGNAAYCWGGNYSGQLGNGTNRLRIPVPTPVEDHGVAFSTVSTGSDHSCGMTPLGAAYCWGANYVGQLGTGSMSDSRVPVPVVGGLTMKVVSALHTHTCAVTITDVAYCWGNNGTGQLGVGSLIGPEDCSGNPCSTVPVAVAGGLSFATVAAGVAEQHECGLTTRGSVYCWGWNAWGQLGNGTTVDSPSPVAVLGGRSYTAVTAGHSHSCALAADATTYCWGNNMANQLGINESLALWPKPAAVVSP